MCRDDPPQPNFPHAVTPRRFYRASVLWSLTMIKGLARVDLFEYDQPLTDQPCLAPIPPEEGYGAACIAILKRPNAEEHSCRQAQNHTCRTGLA